MSADGGEKRTAAPTVQSMSSPPQPTPPPERPRSRLRFYIMAAVPILLVLVGGWYWLTSGRYAGTDNAYVSQDKVTVTGDTSGRIISVNVKENQYVKKGDLLLQLDPEPYKIALAQANAALASARLQVDQIRSTYQQSLAEQKSAQDDLDFNQKAFDRQKDLVAKGVASQAAYDQAENSLHAAQQTLAKATEAVQSALAALGGDPSIKTEDHPLVLAAKAAQDQAALNLKETSVYAPVDGIVEQTSGAQVGGYVTTPSAFPTSLLSIVESDDSWVEANFKETDLTNMRPGQKATVSIDAYPGHKFNAVVESIGAGTGALFSLLPAQNATGNWVKVVQRVPVRIRITDKFADNTVPRAGLSAYVSVDLKSTPDSTQ
jgi:membrane fusion protein (multidrug efflux system)